MLIEDWSQDQYAQLGVLQWSTLRLRELAKDLPIQTAPLDAFNVYKKYDVTMREFVMHMRAVLDADLSYPIILDEDGDIMDGRHRLMKAMLEGVKEIKFVRFDKNPPSYIKRQDD